MNNNQCHVNFKTEQDFLSFAEDKIGRNVNIIALNFAYPISPIFEKGRLDGKLLARSAQLVACQIGGITEFKQKNMVFNMEGGLFWKGNEYKETVLQALKQLAPRHDVKFAEIKDSGILGAAKLVS